jgi:hypothetical protein
MQIFLLRVILHFLRPFHRALTENKFLEHEFDFTEAKKNLAEGKTISPEVKRLPPSVNKLSPDGFILVSDIQNFALHFWRKAAWRS